MTKYVSQYFQNGSAEAFLLLLQHVVRTIGVNPIAQRADMSVDKIFQALDLASKPLYETIYRLLKALNIPFYFPEHLPQGEDIDKQ